MAYSISDTGPAGYDLQRRALEDERKRALASTLISVWAQMQDQAMGQQRMGLERDKFGLAQQELEQQGLRDEAQAEYWRNQSGKETTFDQKFQIGLRLFNGDEKQAMQFAVNPNYMDPYTRRAAENKADIDVPTPQKSPVRDVGKEKDGLLAAINKWEQQQLASLATREATEKESGIDALLGSLGGQKGPDKSSRYGAARKAIVDAAKKQREDLDSLYSKHIKTEGAQKTADLDGVPGAVSKQTLSNGKTAYKDASGQVIGIKD